MRSVLRNIPAYAGKTTGNIRNAYLGGEHPRVCGENNAGLRMAELLAGTSPRMRGKLAFGVFGASEWRNIPAYAGKTLR